jgi:UPF0755 protein
VADREERTAAEREQARLARELRRRGGKAPRDPEPAAEPEPVANPEPVAGSEPVANPEPATGSEPLVAPRGDADPEPAAATDPGGPLVRSRNAPAPAPAPAPTPTPAMRSFPSPPDPEFYVPDAELESPSGTRRVPRAAATGAGDRRPPRAGRASGGARRVPGTRASRPRRWLGRLVALLLLALVAAIVVAVIEIYQPFHSSPHGRVSVHIPAGTSASAVGRILARDGVVSSSLFFELRATLDGDRSRIRAGTYQLARGMSYGAVLSRITAAPKKAKTSQVTLAEGHTRQYVAALLGKEHIRGSYLAATRHSSLLSPRHYGAPSSAHTLEGFLFPDTYTLRDPIRASALVADQLRDFKRRFATVSLTQAHRLHLSSYDIVTIASLIEAESASPADDRRVASVIDNRLRDHMMLQLDSTARYATGNFTKPLTVTQLASKSPYNTHTHFGLPPGPINSPGLTALNAAAHPASSPYLYFFSKPCSDQTVFATSYAQFNLLLLRDRRTHCPH